jgi:PAS domain S-box-containing protein
VNSDAIAAGRKMEAEVIRQRKDGSRFHAHLTASRVRLSDGSLAAYLIYRDITEEKLAADALRESEARFRSLTELSSDWYWRQDENLRFTYFSSKVTDKVGYTGAEALGKTRWELPIMPLTCSWAEHQAVLAARLPFRDFEFRRVEPAGKIRYVSVSGAPVFDEQGAFKGYEGIGRNITERKRIEEELRSRQEWLDLAQKAARAVPFEWRIGAENRWSADLEAMHGLAPGSFDGTVEKWEKLFHPEDWPAVNEAIRSSQRTGYGSVEYRVVLPDGSLRWLQATGTTLCDAEGKAVRMVGFVTDVTQRRNAEDEVRTMERRLRQAQRLEAMGTLAGGIAHDFNNILGAILGYGEMALRDASHGRRLRRDLDSILVAGERGRALVDRILAFSRSSAGERTAVHVEKVVREALDLLAAKRPDGIRLELWLAAGRAAMRGDSTQVHQVVMNLATNAMQAMPSGGTLSVSLDAVHFDASRPATIGAVAAGDWVVLKVADTGSGIAPEIVDRIFDPFFTTKDVGTGTGLGLSLVHGIVTEVGGAIDVSSTPGAGSAFTVYFPRVGEAAEARDDGELEMPRGGGQHVLIVDDEEPLVALAARTLEELGYAPAGFTSSAAALCAFRAEPERFHALITDERMPGMCGTALIREVRGIRRSIPIVLMSGFIGGPVLNAAREAGADEVLKKPLSARELATSLARILRTE